jgi:hypothetical protein
MATNFLNEHDVNESMDVEKTGITDEEGQHQSER